MSNAMPAKRRETILLWLRESKSLTVKQLAERLAVSTMTIHRDLDRLAREGAVKKVHGGAVLVAPREAVAIPDLLCAMCRNTVSPRAAFTISPPNGEETTACCPHCGLMLLHHMEAGATALTPDFLYGRITNVFQAFFVMGSAVQLCCVPGVLCFSSEGDAAGFQRGFGGESLNFTDTMKRLMELHLAG